MNEKINEKKDFIDTKEIIAPEGLEIEKNFLKLGNFYVKTYFIYTFPKYLTSNWLSQIINLPELTDISIYINPLDTGLFLKNLQKKSTNIQAQILDNQEKNLVRDPMLDAAFQDVEKLRDELIQGQEKIFDIGIYITLYALDYNYLSKIEQIIKSNFESKLIYIKPAIFQQLEGFHSILPIQEDKLQIYNTLNSSPASSIFPFISSELNSEKGILYGINLHNNSLVVFDRFSLENANMVIFAKSGAGKSYTAKLEILRNMMLGLDVIIIDPENEYYNLCNTVGGSYFKISLTSPNHINPLDIPIIPEDEDPKDVFKSHILNLTGLLKLMLGEIKPEEEALLDKIITNTYASRDITEENFGKKEMIPPLLEDLQIVLQNTEGGKELAIRLDKFVHGTFSGFTNMPTNVNINNRIIVFSIRDLEEELRPIAMYIILNFVWNLIRSKLKKRIMVIDEAWWMMKYKDSASFLFGLVKRCRKYYLGVTTITQDVNDFINSEYGKPIVTNSAIQLLLKQSPLAINGLGEIFNLTEGEKNFLLQANIGEGLFLTGLKHTAIKIVASYTEDQIITTNPEQILKLKGLKK